MRPHTNQFKEELKKMGKQIDNIISFGNTELLRELRSVTFHYEGNLLKSIMKQLDIESDVDIPINTIVNYKLGILVNGAYEYLDYGNYIVYKSEIQEDTKRYKITCCDKMLYSMKKNENLGVSYPITIKNYLNALATKIGLQLKNTSFNNQSIQISAERYLGLDYTYRDILDEIAQATGSIIIINSNDQLEVKYPTITGDSINGRFLKDTDVKFGKKYGPINSIVITRAEESDSVYLRDEESIRENGLCEVKISNNQLMNYNDRSDYLQGIFNALNGLTYYINNMNSKGILYYEIGDFYNVNIEEKDYQCLMLNDEIIVSDGIEEIIYTDEPEQTKTDYDKADKTDRRINETYLIVDKQNQVIESVVTNVTDQNNKISRLEQNVDEIISSISDIADITTSQETITGSLNFTSINQSEPIRVEIYPTGENIACLHPFETLFPAENLYIKLRTLRFKNISTNEVFDYELPDDLLYYNSENYDKFILDYDSQTIYINKKCKYNTTTGAVELLPQEITRSYEYPTINLTDGDYLVQVLKYDNTVYPCYLFVRLMSQNIYTTQFATHAEVNSKITQTTSNINLSVDQKLTNYSTTNQMNSAIDIKADEITSSVSETYETKSNAQSNYSAITQTTTEIISEVGQKVGNNEVISKINQSSESVTINANRINLARKNN